MDVNYDRQHEIYSRLRDDPSCGNLPSVGLTVGRWRQDRIMQPLKPLLAQGNRWLTIGDGNRASEARWLLQQGVDAHATDLATDLLQLAHEQGLISSWGRENAEHLSFPDRSFDYVLIKEAFHHFPRPWLALYEAYRVCRKAVVLLEPNGEHPHLISHLLRRLRRQPSTIYYRFERVGNFVYAPNPIELEKFLIGMGGQQIALRFYNDFWHSHEADAAPIEGGTNRQRSLRNTVQRMIHKRDWLGQLGLAPHGKVGAALFKDLISQDISKDLKTHGWQVKDLPVNPYAA